MAIQYQGPQSGEHFESPINEFLLTQKVLPFPAVSLSVTKLIVRYFSAGEPYRLENKNMILVCKYCAMGGFHDSWTFIHHSD
jgi:hypothetical protein